MSAAGVECAWLNADAAGRRRGLRVGERFVPQRTERVGNLIRAILAKAIQSHLADPRIPPITSITRVEVSPDLSVAQVYVSVMAADAQRRLCLAALRSAAGHLRWMLGRELTLRKTPTLSFHLDDSVRGSFATVELIDRVMAELSPPAAEDSAATDAAPADDADAGHGQEDS